ncbi:TRPM8 channel-associated factor homolog isoform 1-T2 [Discoglossus pictus]
MTANDDYRSLVRGLDSMDFTGGCVPCNLFLIGDSTFPVVVTPSRHVLVAASRYGKGRVVITSHEGYLNLPQFSGFLQNAVSWLKPCPGSVVGVHNKLNVLSKSLSGAGCSVDVTCGLKPSLGVFCTIGYDDHQAQDIITFVREGGGLLIGAQAWYWASTHKQENTMYNFPGNKITSVFGVYFTAQYGEKGKFSLSTDIPRGPIYTPYNFSSDLTQLLKDVSHLDISGASVASELLLHGSLSFPIGLTDTDQCFLGAALYGKGRVVVTTHEGYISSPKLKTVFLNAISWLGKGGNGQIGVNKALGSFCKILQQEKLPCKVTNLVAGISVYCCNLYNDQEAAAIHQFVAEGGGLLIGGHAWYWASQHPGLNVLSHNPGNKILNKFGISVLSSSVASKNYEALDPKALEKRYNFRRALSQFLGDMKNGAELKPPLNNWIPRFKQDVSTFMKLQDCPLITSLQNEVTEMVQRFEIPNVSKKCPVQSCSKEALMLCLAQDVSCLSLACGHGMDNHQQQCKPPVTVQIDATNPGADAWRSTGLYLPPKRSAILVFPASVVGKGLQVQVGCHSDNLSKADKLCRAPVVIHRTCVAEEKTPVSCIWGGLLYVIVKPKSQLGVVPVTVYGAELAPTYIKGETSHCSWMDLIRNSPSPWAELITENIILTVPTDAIRSLEDPNALLCQWDKNMAAISDLAAVPKKFPRPERFVTDVQISAGWMHAGYPIMCHLESARDLTDAPKMLTAGLWGPIHELGHNQQRWQWELPPHTTEATCNLWSVYVHETVFGIPRDRAHCALAPKNRELRIKSYLENGGNLKEWSVWMALETYLQLQEGFGWDPFKKIFADYQTMSGIKNERNYKMNLWAEKFSQIVQRNLAPFFKTWGWTIDDQTCSKLSSLPEWENNPMKKYLSIQK